MTHCYHLNPPQHDSPQFSEHSACKAPLATSKKKIQKRAWWRGEDAPEWKGKCACVCVHKKWVSISLKIVLYLYWCLFCWYKAPPLIMFPSSPPCPQPLSNAVAAIRFSRPLVTLNTLAGCSTLTAVQHMTCCMHNCGHNWHEMQHLQHHWFQTLSQGMWGAYPLEVMMIWTDLFSGDQGARARHYVSKMMVWASWHSPGLSTKHV